MATIFCFTSTGNSLFTAKKLAAKIGGKVQPINNESIQIEDDVIGFVFPVYFWGLPRIVDRFVAEVQITNKNAYVFAVSTSGGSAFGVLGRLKKQLKAKGIRLHYGRNIVSVSSYTPEYTPKDSDNLRQKIDKRIIEIAHAINSRQTNRVQLSTFLNEIAYRSYPNECSDQYFTVAPACTGCGCCQKVCPVKNIAIVDRNPEFLHKCEHCLACLHNCPTQAIDWNKKTQGKARYRNAEISLDELISFNNTKDTAREHLFQNYRYKNNEELD